MGSVSTGPRWPVCAAHFARASCAGRRAFGGAQLVLKGPISDRCTEAGLKGCESLTDGVLEYVDGDRDEAVQKIKKGAAQNFPEKIHDFAEALRALKSIPGADQSSKSPIRSASTVPTSA